jgi:hypothetical protein
MESKWKKSIVCATSCARCNGALSKEDKRILSAYDHAPICLSCKKEEEARPDYEKTAREMVGACMADTELLYGDPGGYCFYHFYPFTC